MSGLQVLWKAEHERAHATTLRGNEFEDPARVDVSELRLPGTFQVREIRINAHNTSTIRCPSSSVYRCYDMTGRCVLYVMYAHCFIDWVVLSAMLICRSMMFGIFIE